MGVTAPPPMPTAFVRGSEVRGPALGSQPPSAREEGPLEGGGSGVLSDVVGVGTSICTAARTHVKKAAGTGKMMRCVPAIFNNRVETLT